MPEVETMRFHGPGWVLDVDDRRYMLWAPQDGVIKDPHGFMSRSSSGPRLMWCASWHRHLQDDDDLGESEFVKGDSSEEVMRIFPENIRLQFEAALEGAVRDA